MCKAARAFSSFPSLPSILEIKRGNHNRMAIKVCLFPSPFISLTFLAFFFPRSTSTSQQRYLVQYYPSSFRRYQPKDTVVENSAVEDTDSRAQILKTMLKTFITIVSETMTSCEAPVAWIFV
jgi:hypothetical protein